MTTRSTDAEVVDHLVELSRLMVGVAYRSVEGTELDLPQFRALAFIGRSPGCSMGELAQAVALPPSSATRLCDRLVEQEWVRREHGPSNRRLVLLTLTDHGQTLVRSVINARRRELRSVLRRLTPQQVSTLSALLPDLLASTDKLETTTLTAWAL